MRERPHGAQTQGQVFDTHRPQHGGAEVTQRVADGHGWSKAGGGGGDLGAEARACVHRSLRFQPGSSNALQLLRLRSYATSYLLPGFSPRWPRLTSHFSPSMSFGGAWAPRTPHWADSQQAVPGDQPGKRTGKKQAQQSRNAKCAERGGWVGRLQWCSWERRGGSEWRHHQLAGMRPSPAAAGDEEGRHPRPQHTGSSEMHQLTKSVVCNLVQTASPGKAVPLLVPRSPSVVAQHHWCPPLSPLLRGATCMEAACSREGWAWPACVPCPPLVHTDVVELHHHYEQASRGEVTPSGASHL